MPAGEVPDVFDGVSGQVPEELAQHLRTVALVDHHVHGSFTERIDRATFEFSINEGSNDPVPPWMTQFDSPLGFAIRRWCAPLLGLPPHADAETYWKRRDEFGPDELATTMLPAAGVSRWIVDTGFKGDRITSHRRLAELAGGQSFEIVRLERLAEDLIDGGTAPQDFPEAMRSALASAVADPAVVGTKTIVAYRTGFDIDWNRPSDAEVVTHARALAANPGPVRIDDPVLIAFGCTRQPPTGCRSRCTWGSATAIWICTAAIPCSCCHCFARCRRYRCYCCTAIRSIANPVIWHRRSTM